TAVRDVRLDVRLAVPGGVPRRGRRAVLRPPLFREAPREGGPRGQGPGLLQPVRGARTLPRVRAADPRAPRAVGRDERVAAPGPAPGPGPRGRAAPGRVAARREDFPRRGGTSRPSARTTLPRAGFVEGSRRHGPNRGPTGGARSGASAAAAAARDVRSGGPVRKPGV